jgi:GWxTD domain-containing protein
MRNVDMRIASNIRRSFLGLALGCAVSVPALAQESDLMSDGILAFRQDRYDDAVQAFERVVEMDPQNAEAHFLLARLYFETPLRDVKRAGQELDVALEIDPENVQYLVARLEQLRVEANNFFVEKIRESKRLQLAQKILTLDSLNAFAHEELGIMNIRDFWRYRNAIAIPRLAFVNPDYERAFPQAQEFDAGDFEPGSSPGAPAEFNPFNPIRPYSDFDAAQFNYDDEFNIETIASQGFPVQGLRKRADRAYVRAVAHLETSLSSDPRRRSVYENLIRIYALRDEPLKALELLYRMFQYFPEDSFLWENLGYSHYRSGNLSAAAVSFKRALELMPEEEQYVFENLEYILPNDERRRYEDDRSAYASRFWTSKDPRYLTPYNERKLEHYARIVYADLLYSAPDVDKRGWETDRGRILIRYGLPDADVTLTPTGSTNDRFVISTAVLGTMDVTDFSADLVEESNRYNIWEYGNFRFVFEDPFNNGRFRFYSPPADAISNGRVSQAWINDYEIRSKETFRKYPDQYEYTPPGRQVDIPFLVSSFRGAEGDVADVYVQYGIPVTEYDTDTDLIEITANVGTFLVNDQRDLVVERRKTLYGLSTRQIVGFDDLNLWVSSELVSSPGGKHDVSMEFETSTGGTVAVQRREVTIPDFSLDRLRLSDVMLAYHVEETPDGQPLGGADIVRNSLSILPAPWSVFNHRQPIYLYFEVYGLRQGADERTDFEVEARLSPKEDRKGLAGIVKGIFGGGDKGVSVTTPVSGVTPDDYQYLILDASNQEPGLYTLEVHVRDNLTGKSVDRSTDLFLE